MKTTEKSRSWWSFFVTPISLEIRVFWSFRIMTILHFVETRQTEKNKSLCSWVERFYLKGHKIQVTVSDHLEAQTLDHLLWVFRQASFIPHQIGAPNGTTDSLSFVFLTTELVKIPETSILVMAHKCQLDFVKAFEQGVHFICMDDNEHKVQSRNYWTEAAKIGLELRHHPYQKPGYLR